MLSTHAYPKKSVGIFWQESGLSEWIGEQLAVFGSLPGWLMVAIICFLVAMLTEVTSNSATCTILMPIVAAMASVFTHCTALFSFYGLPNSNYTHNCVSLDVYVYCGSNIKPKVPSKRLGAMSRSLDAVRFDFG